MEEKIVIRKTGYLVWIGRLTFFLVVGGLIYLAVIYPGLPDRIPSHFGLDGKADGWQEKWTIWIFQAIEVGVYILLTLVLRFPGAWNTGVAVTKENKEWVYQSLAKVLAAMRLIMVCLFGYTNWGIVRGRDLNGTVLFLLMAGLFVPMILYLVQAARRKKTG